MVWYGVKMKDFYDEQEFKLREQLTKERLEHKREILVMGRIGLFFLALLIGFIILINP
jgi:hypothetical protein